jgi:hypothetical protein
MVLTTTLRTNSTVSTCDAAWEQVGAGCTADFRGEEIAGALAGRGEGELKAGVAVGAGWWVGGGALQAAGEKAGAGQAGTVLFGILGQALASAIH